MPLFFLPILPILWSWIYLRSRKTMMKLAWLCRVVSALCLYSAPQRPLAGGTSSVERPGQEDIFRSTEVTPEHETTRTNRFFLTPSSDFPHANKNRTEIRIACFDADLILETSNSASIEMIIFCEDCLTVLNTSSI